MHLAQVATWGGLFGALCWSIRRLPGGNNGYCSCLLCMLSSVWPDGLDGDGHPVLPMDLLAEVLSCIEQKQRFLSCSLVSKAWNDAVKLTSKRLACGLAEPVQYQALGRWLANNSSISCMETIAVQSSLERWNDVDFAALPVLQLPLQKLCKLQQLELQLCHLLPAESASSTSLGSGSSAVQHTADSAARGLPAQLTALTKLSLDCCKVDLGDLSYCTSVLHLDLTLLMVTDRELTDLDGKAGVEGLIIRNILANLPQLRFLQLDALIVSEGMLQFSEFSSALDNLQQLQVLRLGSRIVTDEDSLNDIPVSLTQLSLRRPKNWWYGPTPSVVATPRLSQLSELQHLDLRNVYYFEPALLTSYPQLTHLTLKQAMYAEEGYLLALMSALQSLKHLQHMDLDGSLLHDMPHQEPYASLTLSSTLTHLDLRGCYYPRQEVHPVIFNPGQASMASLLHLTLDLWWNEAGSSVAALEPIAQCCSALQQLTLVSWSIADAVQVSPMC